MELATSRFRYAATPRPLGYTRTECFYRRGGSSSTLKALQHPLDMARLARHARGSIAHFQWLPIPSLDRRLVRRFERPRVLTAHDILPREAGARRRNAARRLFDEMDAVVVHSRSGRERLVDDLGVDPALVHVIPHGSFEHLARGNATQPIDPVAGDLDGHEVVLFFGLIRPYKGLDVLIEAFGQLPGDAVLLVAGMPRVPIEPLRRRVEELGLTDRVRFVPRFISDPEIPAYFERADVVALPYRETEQSGVLFTALAFGKPVVASDIGGFSEVGRDHAAIRLVAPDDPGALAGALGELLRDEDQRERLSQAARAAASGPYSWARAAELTEALYRGLLP